jgi:PhnB protein
MEKTMQNKPHRFGELTPYFTVTDADYFITFLSEVFAANIVKDSRYEDGTLQHARLQIGDSLIMLNQANGTYAAMQMQMHLNVANVDDTLAKAISKGATSIMKPMLRPHGDKMAGFCDPMGNIWWVAQMA